MKEKADAVLVSKVVTQHNIHLKDFKDLVARAKKLGLESNEVRRRNFIKKDQFPYVSPSGNVYDSGDYEASLNLLLEKADYDQLRREQLAAQARGRLVGIGVASSIEPGLTGPPMLALASPRIFSRTSSPRESC